MNFEASVERFFLFINEILKHQVFWPKMFNSEKTFSTNQGGMAEKYSTVMLSYQ